ncbi:hypothetical protein [Catenovulum agarivorans]|uniref:hypothetical protein n=1 Tax=Catenovulum agarivorans TaxID=1172192 RepID=UPI00037A32F0|nr:hypothetical protein [Catenovulum agarivorans]
MLYSADTVVLKPSGGNLAGLVISLCAFLVIMLEAMIGKVAGLIVFGSLGALFVYLFFKKFSTLSNGI